MTKQERLRLQMINDNEKKLIIEGHLYNSASDYVVVVQDDGKSVELDDTLMRSNFLHRNIRIIIELKGE
uniref:Uncharacterized protein n=1 Tax=viral metagenome TaxID=1070528 RepID=A0A6M3XUI0_9ZZZZ